MATAPVFLPDDPGPVIRRKLNEMGEYFAEAGSGLEEDVEAARQAAATAVAAEAVATQKAAESDASASQAGIHAQAAGQHEAAAEAWAGQAADSAGDAAASKAAADQSASDAGGSAQAAAADAASARAARDTTITARGEAIQASADAGQAADRAENAQEAAESILEQVQAHGNGWTPALAAVLDGERAVVQVLGWSGGTGTPPPTGYLGETGIVATADEALNIRGAPGEGGGDVGSVNGVAPDASGNVAIGIGDIPGLNAALAAAGQVKTVAGVAPEANGNVPLTAQDVGADAAGTAADEVAMLGDSLAAVAYTGHLSDLEGAGTAAGLDAAVQPTGGTLVQRNSGGGINGETGFFTGSVMAPSFRVSGNATTRNTDTLFLSGDGGVGGFTANTVAGMLASLGIVPTSLATGLTYAYRDTNGHSEFFAITLTREESTDRNSDTVFYSSDGDQVRKNTAAGMRASLGLAGMSEADAVAGTGTAANTISPAVLRAAIEAHGGTATGGLRYVEFTASGSWTPPAYPCAVVIEYSGGGGGGGGGVDTNAYSGGGGGASEPRVWQGTLSEGGVSFVVGAGGVGAPGFTGTIGAAGGAGGDTTLSVNGVAVGVSPGGQGGGAGGTGTSGRGLGGAGGSGGGGGTNGTGINQGGGGGGAGGGNGGSNAAGIAPGSTSSGAGALGGGARAKPQDGGHGNTGASAGAVASRANDWVSQPQPGGNGGRSATNITGGGGGAGGWMGPAIQAAPGAGANAGHGGIGAGAGGGGGPSGTATTLADRAGGNGAPGMVRIWY